jgi:hypothetical protein
MIAALRQVVESHPLMPHQKVKPQEVVELGWWNTNYKQLMTLNRVAKQ